MSDSNILIVLFKMHFVYYNTCTVHVHLHVHVYAIFRPAPNGLKLFQISLIQRQMYQSI